MTPTTTGVMLFKGATLVLGGLVTYYSYRAYRRTRSPPLRTLAVGFGIVTLGSLLAGLVDVALLDSRSALLVESVFTTVGFATVLYSLYAKGSSLRAGSRSAHVGRSGQ